MAVDRSRLPVPGPPRPFVFPHMARRQLANGLDVRAISHHSVPVAAVVLLVPGGSSTDEDRPGLTSLLADLLDEGSRGSSALEVSDRIARLGGDLDIDVGHDAVVVSLTALDRYLEPGLSLVHEVSTEPNLDEADVARIRQLRLERLRQLRDHPSALADRAFAAVLYQSHPYAQPVHGTATSLEALTTASLRQHHARLFEPAGATLVVASSRPAAELLALAETVFGPWTNRTGVGLVSRDRGRDVPPARPALPLGVIARPGAAQSELRIGHVAAARSTPDYHALLLLNTVLGGQFVSRLNMNLREDKGYTYGVRTGFDLRRGRGPFVVQTSVGTDVTVAALRESLAEIRDIRDRRPVTGDELALAKSSVALGYPRGFETVQQVARSAAQLALHDLPDTYFEEFVPRLEAVTLDELADVTRRHLDPDRLATIVVGDAERWSSDLSSLGLGEPATVEPPI
jgi:predicted Zn-dependent peptidase